MPVTRPLLSCSPFLSFQSALRASGQSCAQCPSFLHNLHFVQVEKSCSPLAHSPHLCCLCCLRCSCCFNLYNSQLHLSLPLRFRGAACAACASCCGCLDGEQSRSGRISMHSAEPLGRWVFWRCRPHRVFMWETQTYFVSRYWWCRHAYRSTFTLFIFPSC